MRAPLPEAALKAPRRRKRRKYSSWTVRLEHVVFLGLRGLLRRMSLRAAYRLAETALVLYFTLTDKHRRRGLASLQVAFGGERSLAWRRRVLWASIRNLAWTFVEAMLVADICGDARHLAGLDLSQIAPTLASCSGTTGALALSSHQGNADLMATALAAKYGVVNMTAARVLDNPHVNALMVSDRERFGRGMVNKKGFLRQALRCLQRKGVAALLIDQDMGSRGLFVPYFGVPASTTGGGGMLAVLTGAPVFMGFFIRDRDRRLEYTGYLYPLEVTLTGDREEDVYRITAASTLEVERFSRRFPEQGFWVHRRWKSRPPE